MKEPSDTIVILGHPRSGTHLLLGLLEANGYGYVGELFADTLYLSEMPLSTGVKSIHQRLNRSRRNGKVACSVMANHLDKVCVHLGLKHGRGVALECMFDPCTYVLVRREDTVAQAVSFVCSKHSGKYHSHEKAKRPLPTYSEMRIAREIQLLRSPEMTWGDLPTLLNAVDVTYEELSTKPASAMHKLSKAIGWSLDVVTQKRFNKVAGRLEQEYIEAFKASQSSVSTVS